MKPIAPPRVANTATYFGGPPPEPSARLLYWQRRIADGWRPNRRIWGMGYHGIADYLGVYVWEWQHVLYPPLAAEIIAKNQAAVGD